MILNINQFTDYKDYLFDLIDKNQQITGYRTLLADAAKCQKSYLSQVLNGSQHLSLEQGIGICLFLQLPPLEQEYFLTMIQLARAGNVLLEQYHQKKLKDLKTEMEKFSRPFKPENITTEEKASLYYSSWHLSAIHILLTIPGFNTTKKISHHLNVSSDLVDHYLEKLKHIGFAYFDGEQWKSTQQYLHVPKESSLVTLHHANWRHKAIENSARKNAHDIHYTAVYSLSRKDVEAIRQTLLTTIEDILQRVARSPEEKLVAMACDFFEV